VNPVQADWMGAANCVVDDPFDTRFIRRPSPIEEDEWGFICSQCSVFSECLQWADEVGAIDVWIAGEYREPQ